MPYRLALDVGTASCGLVVWTLDEQGQPLKHAYDSLDIWSEPLLPAKSGGVGEPKKAARRAARMMRRGHCRRVRKLRRIAHLASALGLKKTTVAPSDIKKFARKDGREGRKIHALRAQAAEERIELADLLRVLLRIAKNRGPSGDWVYAEPEQKTIKGKRSGKNEAVTKSDADETAAPDEKEKKAAEEMGKIVGGVRKLEHRMHEAALALGKTQLTLDEYLASRTKDDAGKTVLTLGQYLHYRLERDEGVILGKPDIGLYPSRRMVEQEFNKIWDTQKEFHPVLKDTETRQKFFDAIFHQRPLKSPAPMVGRCPLEPTLPRAPAAQIAAQTFRIEKQIADLRWGMGRRQQPLNKEQKAIIRELLADSEKLTEKGELSFQKILKELEAQGYPAPVGLGLNMDRASRENLKGNTTLATFSKLGLESEWKALDEKTQVQAINFLADLGSPDALDSDKWHENFATGQIDPATKRPKMRVFGAELVAFINLMRRHPKFARLSTMGFDSKRMGYSIKALKKLTLLMQEGWDERMASEQAYPDHFKERPLSRELPIPEETGNTVVDVALRQVYRAVRRAMEAMHCPPAQVIVELSRDMALGLKQRGEIETKIKVNNKARRDAAKAISDHGEPATDKNIDRYLLWESQLHYCPYCAHRIELGEALGSETEREHILPRSLTRVGGKRSQLVLAHKTCNNQKGNTTPWLKWGDGKDPERWRIIEERAKQLEKNKQWGKAKLLLLKDWETEVLDDDAIKGFTDRQFHESAWIAKLTARWLRSVCSNVAVSRGEMTAHLRRIWKLDTVIPEVRYSSGLPVLDREGKQISAEEFERHKLWWEGHDKSAGGVPTERKPDKRIDHRHHLIDALVISLTDRKLFKKMADNYKLESEKAQRGERAKLNRYVEPPFTALRDLAVNLVTNSEPRHKPDRHPDGALFEQFAYGISRKPDENGEHQLARSKQLTDLIDIKTSNVEKTRKALENIESESTRNEILKAFDARIASGTSLKQVFDAPILNPQFQKPIKRVRLLGNSIDTSAEIRHTNRQGQSLYKRYAHDGNAFLEIRVEDGKLVGKPRLVNVQQAILEKGSRPPQGITRFWKGDTVRLADSTLHLVGIIAAQGGGQLRLVPITETCNFGELKKRGLTMKTVSGDALAKVSLVNV